MGPEFGILDFRLPDFRLPAIIGGPTRSTPKVIVNHGYGTRIFILRRSPEEPGTAALVDRSDRQHLWRLPRDLCNFRHHLVPDARDGPPKQPGADFVSRSVRVHFAAGRRLRRP